MYKMMYSISFDIINMFPSIDNQLGIERFHTKLIEFSHCLDVPVECIVEALEICLKNNCSKYREQYWLQENGTAMGPKNSCSYADIVAEFIDIKVLESRQVYPELRYVGLGLGMIHLHCGEAIRNVFKPFFKLLMGLIQICSLLWRLVDGNCNFWIS